MSINGKSWNLRFYETVTSGPNTLLGTVTLSPEISSSLTNSTINFQIAQINGDNSVQSLSEVLMDIGETG